MSNRVAGLVSEILELYACNENLSDSTFFVKRDNNATTEESIGVYRELKKRFPKKYA